LTSTPAAITAVIRNIAVVNVSADMD